MTREAQMIIGCIPVRLCPEEPTDQSKPITQEECPDCGAMMWVSARKRKLRDGGTQCKCMICVVKELDDQHTMVDLNKLN